MSVNPAQNSEAQSASQPSDKEINFRKQEEMFNRKLEQERLARQQAEERLERLEKAAQETKRSSLDDDDDDDEPYIDKKRLKRELGKVQQTVSESESRIQQAVQMALAEERRTQWLKSNPDFEQIMQHAQAFAEKDPELAETILEMPNTFERQKLVYKNIKALGIHKPKEDPKPTMQDKINQNRKHLMYQPTGTEAPPFEGSADFSSTGQQQAYKKMKELQKRLGGVH